MIGTYNIFQGFAGIMNNISDKTGSLGEIVGKQGHKDTEECAFKKWHR